MTKEKSIPSEGSQFMVYDHRKKTYRPGIKQTPLLSSQHHGWEGLLVESHRISHYECVDFSYTDTLIAIHTNGTVPVQFKDDGQFRDIDIHKDDVVVFPANRKFSFRLDTESAFTAVSLNQNLLLRLSAGMYKGAFPELVFHFNLRDPFLQNALIALNNALASGQHFDHLYSETVIQSLAAHLVKNYAATKSKTVPIRGQLSRRNMDRIEEYLRANLGENIRLQDLARLTGLSPFHFSRLFKQTTGITPHQYVLRRRVEHGADLLKSEKFTVAQVAVESGFADQSHFSTHFRRYFHMSPGEFVRRLHA